MRDLVMNLLVTGGAGFIGSNFIQLMASKYPQYTIVNLDNLTYAGKTENNSELENDQYHFIQGDICDAELLDEIFERFDINAVVHFAAESHVDRSIVQPSEFFKTNIFGTEQLVETARRYWQTTKNHHCTSYKEHVKFIQISTDEVYGTLGEEGYFIESSPIQPNSPYSASKAAADLIVRAYVETYSFPALITRCSNNYGPHQHIEKFIPNMILHARQNESLPLYGDGQQVRDWLYVEDHCRAIDLLLHKGAVGEVYNIGGNNEERNIDVTKKILQLMPNSASRIEFVEDRLGHDKRYAIDSSKLKEAYGWTPTYLFEEGLKKTLEWYEQFFEKDREEKTVKVESK